MESVTVSEKLPLTVSENSVRMVSVFHGLARNLGLYACLHPITKDSLLSEKHRISLLGKDLQTVSTEFCTSDSMKFCTDLALEVK